MLNYFNFKPFGGKVLITNDFGRYSFLSQDAFKQLIAGTLLPSDSQYQELKDKFFLYDGDIEVFLQEGMPLLQDGKKYLFAGTSLFILVVTTWCNASCVYCQAKDTESTPGFMSKETATKAVDIALSSPVDALTIEFQGGEPLGNFEVIQHTVLYAEERAKALGKHVAFSLVSNLSLLNDEIATFINEHAIALSTSIDGDKELHDHNRPFRNGIGSFDAAASGIQRARKAGIALSAIQTTTRQSLSRAKPIIDTYLDFGMASVFIRPLTPLGMAHVQWESIGYSPEMFLAFYRECITYLLEVNKGGQFISEGHVSIMLTKILFGEGMNYMELRSPCGASIGQMAFYYDGAVYTCDEGRMLAEMGNNSFRLGTVEDTYDSLITSPACKAACAASVLESIPECCDCVYQPYCGQCPVINLALDGDIFPTNSQNYRCKIYKGMLDILFGILQKNDQQELQILQNWAQGGMET